MDDESLDAAPGEGSPEPQAGGVTKPVAARRLRLALFSYGLPVEGVKRGGIERVAHDLADGLARRGHEVTVWSYDPKPPGAPYAVRGLPFRRFVESWFGRRITTGYLGNFLPLIPRYGSIDAVIALGDSLLLPLKGVPVVRVMCGSALGEAVTATSPWRFLLQSGVYFLELISALTQRWTVGISNNTRRHNPFVRHVIPIGVDRAIFRPGGEGRANEPTVLFVGTLSGRKRGSTLVRWFEQIVLPKMPDARLIIVGPQGPPAPGITYETGISMAALAQLYRSAWVYASPSSYEGFGLPYVEAMASGTPVIATPNPGSREVLGEGEFGVLADDEHFAPELLDLLANGPRREALSQKGLERAERYSLENVIHEYERLLLGIVEGAA